MANSGGLTFELNNFDQFKRELGTLSKAVDEINASLKTVKGTTDDIKPTFKNVFEEFEKFANQLKTIDLAGAANFDSFKSTVLKLDEQITDPAIGVGIALAEGIEHGFEQYGFKWTEIIAKKIIESFKQEFGISSPSTKFIQIGEWIAEGLWIGFEKIFEKIKPSISNFFSQLKGGFSSDNFKLGGLFEVIEKVKNSLNFDINASTIAKALILKLFITDLAKTISIFDSIKSPDNLEKVLFFVKNIGGLIDAISLVKGGNYIDAIKGLVILVPILKTLSIGLSSLNNVNFDLDNMVLGMRSLFIFLKDFSNSSGSLRIDNLYDLFDSVLKIVPTLFIIGKALSPLNSIRAESVNAAANFLPALQQFITEFATTKDIPEAEISQKNGLFRQVLKLLPTFFILAKALGQFNSVKIIQNSGFSEFGLGIKRLIDSMQSLESISRVGVFNNLGAIKNVRNAFKAIAEGIKEFDNIKFNEKNIKYTIDLIDSLGKSLEQINRIDSSGLTQKIKQIQKAFREQGDIISTSVGQQLGANIAQGIASSEKEFRRLGALVAFAFADEFKAMLGISSPSKLFARFGEFVKQGFEKGADGFDKIGTKVTDAFVDATSSGLNKGIKLFGRILFETGKKTGKDFVDAIKESTEPLQSIFKSRFNQIAVVAGSALAGYVGYKIGTFFVHQIADGISGGIGLIKSAANIAVTVFTKSASIIKDSFVAAFDFIGTSASKLSDKFSAIGNTLRDFGRNTFDSGRNLAIGGGIAALITGSQVSLAANFDQILNQVRVFGNLSQQELSKVSDGILSFSERTIFDPTQSVSAFLELQKAGLSAADALVTLNASGDLAAAGGIALTESTSGLIRVLQTFQLPMTEAANVADYLTQAANLSTAGVNDLLQGFGNVGPVANQFGLSVQETAAILAKFNDAGIVGAEAGTQLKSMLSNLTRSTKETNAIFAELGVSLSDAQGNFRPINDIINDLNSALFDSKTVTVSVMSGISAEQKSLLGEAEKAYESAARQIMLYENGLSSASEASVANKREVAANAANLIKEITGSQQVLDTFTAEVSRSQAQNFTTIQKLAGTFGQAGLSVLLSQDEDAINNFIAEMSKLPGATEISMEMMKTFKGTLDTLKGSFETLLIKALIPVMRHGLQPLTEVGIKFLNAITSLPEEILAIGAGAVALVAVLTTLAGVGMMIVGGVLLPLGLAFSSLATIMGVVALVFTNPLGLIAGAAAFGVGITAIIGTIAAVTGGLATLTAGLYLFIDSASNNDAVVNSFNDMRDSIGSVFTTVKDFLGSWVDLISKFDIGSSAAGTANSSFTPLVNLFNSIKDKAKELAGALSEVTTFVNLLADTYDYMNGKNNGDSPNLDRFEKEKVAIQEQIDALGELDEATASTTVTVKSGDNLTKLAEQYNTSVEAILAANEQITNPSFIRSGDEIIIPGLTATNDELERLEKKLSDVEKRERMFAEQADAMGFVSAEKQLTGLQKRVDEFSKTELGKKIFGEDADISNFITQIGRIESTFKRMGTQLGFFREGISELFTGDFSSGAKKATKSLQRLGGLFTTLIEQTTGIDISDKFQDILNEGTTKDLAKFIVSQIGNLIVSGIDALIPIVQDAAKNLFIKALEALGLDDAEIQRALEFVSAFGDRLTETFDDISKAFSSIDTDNYIIFVEILKAIGIGIGITLAGAFTILSGVLNSIAPAIDIFDGFVELLYGIAHLDTDAIGDGIRKIAAGIVDLNLSFYEGALDGLADVFDLIGKPEWATTIRDVAGSIGEFADKVRNLATDEGWNEAREKISAFMENPDFDKLGNDTYNFIKGGLDSAIEKISAYDWAGLKNKVVDGISNAIGQDNLEKIEETAQKIKDFITNSLNSAAQKLGFEDAGVLKDAVANIIKTGFSLGEDVASSIGDEIKSIFSTGISDAGLKIEGGISFDNIKNKISDAIKNININEDTISEIGTKIKNTISSGFDSASKELTDFSNNETVLAVKDKISGIVTSLFENPPTIDFNVIIQPIKDFASGLTDALGEFDLGLIDTVKNGVREVAEFFGVSEELGFDDASENINEVKEALSGMSADLAEQGIKFDFGENLALSEENIEALQFLGETFASYIAEGIGSEISLAAINSAIDSAINGIVINSTSLINQLRSVMESITALTSGGSMAFGAMKIAVSAHITSMQPVVKAFEKTIQELTFAVQKLIGAFLNAQAIVGAGDVSGAQQFQAAFNANGRAFGGTVEPNKIYEFNEERKGVPFEIFQTNGRNYLLSSERGFMHSPLNSRPISGGGETVIYQDYSTIQVNGSGLSREELTRAIVDAKREEQLNNPFYLRTKRAGI